MSFGVRTLDSRGRPAFQMSNVGALVLSIVNLGTYQGWSTTLSFPEVTGRDVRVVVLAGQMNVSRSVTYPNGVPTVTLTVNAVARSSPGGVAYILAK